MNRFEREFKEETTYSSLPLTKIWGRRYTEPSKIDQKVVFLIEFQEAREAVIDGYICSVLLIELPPRSA